MRASGTLGMIFAVFIAGLAACEAGPSATTNRAAGGTGGVTDREVRALVTGIADDYVARLAEAIYLSVRGGSIDSRARALLQSFLRNGIGASIDIAAGPNPDVALLDLMVLSRLQAWSFRSHWIGAGIGDATGVPAADLLDRADLAVWRSASRVLNAEQIATVEELVTRWIEENGDRTVVSLTRFEEFTDARNLRAESLRRRASGLLRQVTEASTAVETAVDLGDRALWYSARYPYVVGEQTELTVYRLMDQPEFGQVMGTLEAARASAAAIESRLRTLDTDLSAQQDELFGRIAAEREATLERIETLLDENMVEAVDRAGAAADRLRETTIDHLFDRVATERRDLLDDIESRQTELQGLMSELQATIAVTGDLAGELTGTIEVIDRLASRFERDPGEVGEPLSLSDVRDVAVEFRYVAQNAIELLETSTEIAESRVWDDRLAMLDRATTGTIDRVFWRGVWLILILVAGLVVVRLIPQRKG